MIDVETKKQIYKALFVRTQGIISKIPIEEQLAMLSIAREIFLNGITDFAVFDPNATEKRFEDENRTVIIPYPRITKKVWVKLDDYGDIKTLEEWSGITGLQSRFVITMMFPEEY